MNTVKRWLAGFLSFAMIFTGAGFSSLGTVAGFAALTNYSVTVRKDNKGLSKRAVDAGDTGHGGLNLTYDAAYTASAEFGDPINLSVTASTTSVGTESTIYEWDVLQDQADSKSWVTGYESDFSFTPANYHASEHVYVSLRVTHTFMEGNNRKVEQGTYLVDVTIEPKDITIDEVKAPEFVNLYMPYGKTETTLESMFTANTFVYTATDYKTALVAGNIANGTKRMLITKYVDTYGTWDVKNSDSIKNKTLTEGNSIKATVTLTLNSDYTPVGDGWTTTRPADLSNTYDVEKTLVVEENNDVVTSIAAAAPTGGYEDTLSANRFSLVYNEGLANNSKYTAGAARYELTVNGLKNGVSAKMLENVRASSSDEAVSAEITTEYGTTYLDVKANGIPANHIVTVRLYDVAESGIENLITLPVLEGWQPDDITAFADVPKTYTFEAGATVTSFFDAFAANNQQNEDGIYYDYSNQDDKANAVALDTVLVYGNTYTTYGIYALGSYEREVYVAGSSYSVKVGSSSLGDRIPVLTTLPSRFLYKTFETKVIYGEIDDAYVQGAINNIKFDGVKLNGGEIEYGYKLVDEFTGHTSGQTKIGGDFANTTYNAAGSVVTGYDKVALRIQVNNGEGWTDLTTASAMAKKNLPAIGAHTSEYRVIPVAISGVQVADDVKAWYPLDFTVVPASLKTVITYEDTKANSGSSATLTLNGEAITPSTDAAKISWLDGAVDTTMSTVTSNYTYTYQWYVQSGENWTKLSTNNTTNPGRYTPETTDVGVGTYKVEVTAALKAGSNIVDCLGEKTYTTEIRVLGYSNLGVGLYTNKDDVAVNAAEATTTSGYVNTFYGVPGTLRVLVDTRHNVTLGNVGYQSATAATIDDIEVTLRKNGKQIGEPMTAEGGEGFYKFFTITPPADLDSTTTPDNGSMYGTYVADKTANYEIWVKASATVTVSGKEITDNFEQKLPLTYQVASVNLGKVLVDAENAKLLTIKDNEAEGAIVEKDGKDSVEYGTVPSDALAYQFALPAMKLNGKKYTEDDLALITDLVNENFTFTIRKAEDVVSNVGSKDIVVTTAKSPEFTEDNLAFGAFGIAAIGVGDAKIPGRTFIDNWAVSPVQVTKKDLHIEPAAATFTVLENTEFDDEIKADFVAADFVNGDTAESLNLAVDYDILKDGKVVKHPGVGEYDVQFKSTEDPANYNIVAGTAKLIIQSDAQADADAFAAKVAKADLTDAEAVAALDKEYNEMSAAAKDLAKDAYKQVTEAQAVIDAKAAVAASKADPTNKDKADAAAKALAALNDAQKALYGDAFAADQKTIAETQEAIKKAEEQKKAEEEAKQKAADQEAANKVIAQLAGINSSSTQAQAKAAVDAYNALTAAQKALVDANPTAAANLKTAQSRAATPDKTKTTFTYKNAKKTIKASKVKKAKQTFTFKAKAKSGGKVTYKKASGSKKVTISKKGKVTVKKGTKKGTYKIKVKCTAAAKGNFLKTTVKKQIVVKVK